MDIRNILYVYLITISHACYAQTLNDLISRAIENSTKIALSNKETELENIEKRNAKTNFLPNVSASYTDGTRKNTIGNINRNFRENTRTITLQQPLFNGFASVASMKKAKYSYGASKENLTQSKNDIAYQVAEKYLNTYYLEQILSLNQQVLDQLTTATLLVTQSLRLQDIEYAKYVEISVQKNKTDLKINNISSTLQENKLELQIITGEHNIKNLQKPMISHLNELIQLEVQAQNDNPKLKAQKLNAKAKEASVVIEAGNFIPKVSLYVQHERQDASQFFNGRSVTNNVIYLNVDIPIFQQGIEYTSLSRATKEKQIARLEEKLAMEDIQYQLQTAYHKYHSTTRNIASLTEIITSSKQTLNLSKDRLSKQDISKLDVILQEVDIINMQIQKLELELEMHLAYFLIQKVINNIIQ